MSIAVEGSVPAVSEHDRLDSVLAEEFLRASHSSSAAVIAINARLLMANGRASSYLVPANHDLLWKSICEQTDQTSCYSMSLDVPGKGAVTARCSPARKGDELAGAILTLDLSTPPPSAVEPPELSRSILPGSSKTAEGVRREFAQFLTSGSNVLITGEAGTGKSFLARQLANFTTGDPEVVVADGRESAEEKWLEELGHKLQMGETLIIEHLDELEPRCGIPLAEMLESLPADTRVIATAQAPIAACHRLDGLFPGRLHIPPLRNHLEDLPAIASQLLRTWATHHTSYRLSPDARRLLWSYQWFGNTAELQRVLQKAVSASPAKVIEAAFIQLPEAETLGENSAGLLRMDEKQILLNALEQAQNNKLVAANMLGIARSTLYRKLSALNLG